MALVVASLPVGLIMAELTLRFVIKSRAVMIRQLLTQQGVTDADQRGNVTLTSAG
jgi:hypothetical protein